MKQEGKLYVLETSVAHRVPGTAVGSGMTLATQGECQAHSVGVSGEDTNTRSYHWHCCFRDSVLLKPLLPPHQPHRLGPAAAVPDTCRHNKRGLIAATVVTMLLLLSICSVGLGPGPVHGALGSEGPTLALVPTVSISKF